MDLRYTRHHEAGLLTHPRVSGGKRVLGISRNLLRVAGHRRLERPLAFMSQARVGGADQVSAAS